MIIKTSKMGADHSRSSKERTQLRANKRKFEEVECAFCMQQLDPGAQGQGAQGQGTHGQGAQRQGAQRQEALIQLPCHHVFHEDCWRRSYSHGHRKCPNCRRQAPPPPPPPSLAVRSAAALRKLRNDPGFFDALPEIVPEVERLVQAVLQQWATQGRADEMIESESRIFNMAHRLLWEEMERLLRSPIDSTVKIELVRKVMPCRDPAIRVLRSMALNLRVLRSMALNP